MESKKKNPHHIVISPENFSALLRSREFVTAIVGAAVIEQSLDSILTAIMVNDSGFVNKLLDRATLDIKIKTAYALNLIDKETKNELDCIRNIRNEFAHSVNPELSFQDSPVRELCNNLSTVKSKKSSNTHQLTDLFNQAIVENLRRIVQKESELKFSLRDLYLHS